MDVLWALLQDKCFLHSGEWSGGQRLIQKQQGSASTDQCGFKQPENGQHGSHPQLWLLKLWDRKAGITVASFGCLCLPLPFEFLYVLLCVWVWTYSEVPWRGPGHGLDCQVWNALETCRACLSPHRDFKACDKMGEKGVFPPRIRSHESLEWTWESTYFFHENHKKREPFFLLHCTYHVLLRVLLWQVWTKRSISLGPWLNIGFWQLRRRFGA